MAFSLFAVPQAAAQEEFGKITRIEKLVSQSLAFLMRDQHLSGRAIDDSISERAFDMYLKTLDPLKLYFLQSDIDEFKQYRASLDNQMLKGQFTAAFAIFNRLLDRIDQRVDTAMKLIDSEFDYSREEELVTDSDLLKWPKDNAEARELWRKRIKYNLMVLTVDQELDQEKKAKEGEDASSTKKAKDPRETLRKRYQAFAKRMRQTDTQDVVEMYMSAITTSFDPHTSYMSKETFENFLISFRLSLEGIGATLQGTDDGYTVIKRIVPGGAADKQGDLKVEDKIVAVGQGDMGEMVDVTGMKLDDVVKQIRGKAGTKVKLSVMSENGSELRDILIVREKIKLEDSAAKGVVFDNGTKADGLPFKIGVIDLPSFYSDMEGGASADARSTTKDVEKILNDFKMKNVDAVVLDLRRNGGGSLREAIDCTGLFIDTGAVVQVKDSFNQVIFHNDERVGMAWDKPLVVLTSKFSASASEILAGAVQDYKRGIVVGDTTTHGKGTVQNLLDLDRVILRQTAGEKNVFGALKITMSQFYRPNGDSTQKRGVLSDIVLPSITDKMDVAESDLDYPVEFDKIKAADFKPYRMVSNEMLESLRKKSQERINASERFQRLVNNIQQYVKQKNQNSVTLNKEQFIARRKKVQRRRRR